MVHKYLNKLGYTPTVKYSKEMNQWKSWKNIEEKSMYY